MNLKDILRVHWLLGKFLLILDWRDSLENFSPEDICEYFIKQGLKIVSPYIDNKTIMKRKYLKKYSSEIRSIIYSAIEELINYKPQNL